MSQYENLSNAVETCVSLLKSGKEENARFALEWLSETNIPRDILAKYQIKELVEYLFEAKHEIVQKVLSKISSIEGNVTIARNNTSEYSPIAQVGYKFFDYSPNFLRSVSPPSPVRQPQNLTFRGPRRNLKLQLLAQQAAGVDFKCSPIDEVHYKFFDYSPNFLRSASSPSPIRQPQNLTFRGPRRNLKLQLLAQQAAGVDFN